MKYAFAQVALGLTANALVAREPPQCVQLRASGGASGVLGQLSDGQNRVGGGHPTGCYCLSNGGFTDTNGRGCILTPPTTQFQCDVGASPTSGFSTSGDKVTYNGNGKFYACAVNDNGEYNVYTKTVSGQDKCVEISLSPAGSCGSGSTPPQPSKPAQPEHQPAPQPSKSAGGCPTDLNGKYEYPHLIVPVDSKQPSKSYGTSYFGTVNSTTCSIFNFDIPASYSGKTCSLVFLFPEQKDLETSSFTVSGSGKVNFTKLTGPATQQTTWANQPGKDSELQSLSVAPGNSYAIASGSCAAGQTVTYELCSQGDFALHYFQDYNPSPLGLYVRSC
ncbi:uncharacterized protein K460DRAFT_421902 [Cucurbitaria berberidis CBS 394.84]|uniref:Ubiquitin 3 binding protein But2 C-terminal domain-containing protein n=1 Tax=Cucurbitaria berberidis CBS 394.84 TaxID=1168544 RepID=A0A9P4GNF6_9PLEO|nr:uncharacterized protein K460DRAFT_421902 [Cucurbitaria berberidis CBS 394.84]KAF1849688.1 hypothetical protein K460DRAFT_421902 [Cucurbitaria berberidis CBS 394.84]